MLVQNFGTSSLSLGLKIGSIILKPLQACEMTDKEYKTLKKLFPQLSVLEESVKMEGEPAKILNKEKQNGTKKAIRKDKKQRK